MYCHICEYCGTVLATRADLYFYAAAAFVFSIFVIACYAALTGKERASCSDSTPSSGL